MSSRRSRCIIKGALFLLIDTREGPPEPEEEPRRSWVLPLLDWLLPWPALIVFMVVAASMLDGWAGLGCAWAAIVLSAWRVSRAYNPVGGMRDHHQ